MWAAKSSLTCLLTVARSPLTVMGAFTAVSNVGTKFKILSVFPVYIHTFRGSVS